MAWLRPHTVVGQQLAETLLLRPALVGLDPVRLSDDHQVSLRRSVEELAGAVTVMPPPLGQVGAQLTGQHPERVGGDRDQLAPGTACLKKQKENVDEHKIPIRQ